MNHNDRLVRLRYALDIKDNDMVTIFKLGGMEKTKEDIKAMLTKLAQEDEETNTENVYELMCDDESFERFLNGLITSQRGVQKPKEGQVAQEPKLELTRGNANNLLLKKVKIALSLTSDDLLDILDEAGVSISNSELSAVLRKEGHRNYKPCGDRYARNFLKGLALRYRS